MTSCSIRCVDGQSVVYCIIISILQCMPVIALDTRLWPLESVHYEAHVDLTGSSYTGCRISQGNYGLTRRGGEHSSSG
jgi:hypothetical protein